MPSQQDREARVGRAVTWSILAAMAVAAVGQLEVWPLTAFRLFSEVRTADQTRLELVAERLDGTEEPLLVAETNPVLVTTDRQYPDLVRAEEDERRGMVLAWLDVSGVDPATVGSVRLDRIDRAYDEDTHLWTDRGRTTVVDVDL
ncbi:hypothetical protein [Cellulomonas xylanilytica]|uniref:Uncharacterized protein n=1 Tax=Cellulomonas xylanilytica TaxID=233583 RepID=A0A510V6J6_9CELL|nr:hypothetical protein [Cellulomonas xylanilytica]GEK22497.1 hypothetical protein CXY01_30170 [Cellulomonas xylanilytica]